MNLDQMQINFLKIQQKSRENGLVIFSKSNFAIWRENLIVSEIQQNSSKIKFLDTNRTFAPVCRARVEKIPQGKKWQDGTLQNSQT